MDNPQPSIGRIVHYVAHGTPVREDSTQAFPPACRAAIVTAVDDGTSVLVDMDVPSGDVTRTTAQDRLETVSLAVLNPTGMFFNPGCAHDEGAKAGGTWHWPERVGEST